MSLTYDNTIAGSVQPPVQPPVQPAYRPQADAVNDAPFTPVYARGPVRRKGQVKAWMILAPIGALTVAAVGAFALMNPGEDAVAPTAPEPALSAPAVAAAPVDDLSAAPLAGPETTVAPPAAPAERAAPTAAAVETALAPAPASAPPVQSQAAVQEPVVPTGPQPYEAQPETTAPALTVAPSPETPPLVVIQD